MGSISAIASTAVMLNKGEWRTREEGLELPRSSGSSQAHAGPPRAPDARQHAHVDEPEG